MEGSEGIEGSGAAEGPVWGWAQPPSLPLSASQDSSGLRLWKRRWFVLVDLCLYYYRGEGGRGLETPGGRGDLGVRGLGDLTSPGVSLGH